VDCCVVLLNRDLRVHDHPALRRALDLARRVVPLFVLDPVLAGTGVNRVRFLLDCLHDLRAQLRERGGDLAVATGDPVDVAMRVAREHAAGAVVASADVSAVARRREARLAAACASERVGWERCAGVTVVPPEQLSPVGGDHYRVFTPYWRAWRSAPWRKPLAAPRSVPLPPGLDAGRIPELEDLVGGSPSPDLAVGGEAVARRLLMTWRRTGVPAYGERHDDLAADGTSRLSPYLHFGCVSPLEVATTVAGRDGGEPFLRQLCWRDFHHQVTAAFPQITDEEYRPRGDRWQHDVDDLTAWQDGRTGIPIVDAGMRQLRREGWMHNRARLITASYLCKDLYVDWRLGARHFMAWLVDGDVANNHGNWQWVAGTGNDTRPNRVLNPLRQATRFDPHGDYVRRHVPELAAVPGPAVHRPWELDPEVRVTIDYPDPIVDHAVATARFQAARSRR
jgi:deoxyribodipyrimidine photo-lyase